MISVEEEQNRMMRIKWEKLHSYVGGAHEARPGFSLLDALAVQIL
jgi:hypothetical protein